MNQPIAARTSPPGFAESLKHQSKIQPSTMAQESSALLRLPVDIRLYIYEAVFEGQREEIHVEYASECTERGRKIRRAKQPWTRTPSLLLTSKQVYDEAVEVYYSETIFVAPRYQWLRWAQKLTAVRWARLRSFHLDVREGSKPPEERTHGVICSLQKPAEAQKVLAGKRADYEGQMVESGMPLRVGALKLVHHDCDCAQWIIGLLPTD